MIQPSSLLASVLVAVGGGTGAVLRYQLGRAIGRMAPAAGGFPYATLTANVVGSVLMGVLVGWLARHGGDKGIGSFGWGAEGWRLLLGVGLLGGFTTFSSFSMEIVLLSERGMPGMATLYAGVSLAAGIAGMMIGLYVMRVAG